MVRVLDSFLLLLFTYYLWSCIFIERHYCKQMYRLPWNLGVEPLTEKSEGLLKMTYDYSIQWNPLFASRPEWLRLATCFSAYGLGAGYVILFLTFAFKLESLRGLCLLIMGAKTYAVLTYYYGMDALVLKLMCSCFHRTHSVAWSCNVSCSRWTLFARNCTGPFPLVVQWSPLQFWRKATSCCKQKK